jgi:hypothetical protein
MTHDEKLEQIKQLNSDGYFYLAEGRRMVLESTLDEDMVSESVRFRKLGKKKILQAQELLCSEEYQDVDLREVEMEK